MVTTPFSFVASANCLLYEGATPVFCDIDPVTLNMTPESAGEALSEKTTGILPVHIFGYPVDMKGIELLSRDCGLWIVEDACEALGAEHADGTPVGARGNLSVFGFYPNKQITTGEGGMVVSPSAEVKERIDSERNQGRSPDMGWLDHDRLGFNYRLDDMSCALGVAQLERLGELLAGAGAGRGAVLGGAGGRRGNRPALRRRGRQPAQLVRLRGAAAAGRGPRLRGRRDARARGGHEALPARDPPDELLPRALRPQGGRVPRMRGRGGPLAGAALLPAS